MRVRVAWIILDREEQFWHRLVETPRQEMRAAYCNELGADTGARTEAQRGIDMLDRDVGLAGPDPEDAANKPAAGVVRVKREGTVDQRHHGADILAERR